MSIIKCINTFVDLLYWWTWYRWDAGWTSKGAVYGWNLYWTWSTTFQIVNSIRQFIHILGGTAVISFAAACTRDVRAIWRHHTALRRTDSVPGSAGGCSWILWISGVQVPWEEGNCWLLARSTYGSSITYLHKYKHVCAINNICSMHDMYQIYIEQVTSRKDQKQYWAWPDKPYQYVSVQQLSCSFQSFCTGRAITNELTIPCDKSKSHPAALTTSKYGVSAMQLLKANIDREILLLKRNSFVYIFRTIRVTRTVYWGSKFTNCLEYL